MPKKAKKAKITGTPDVVKFKGTRPFNLLKSIISLQEQRSLMSTDFLEEVEYGRISRLLHLLGLLAADLGIEPPHADCLQDMDSAEPEVHPKDYRFHLHHDVLAPAPQIFPTGYPVDVIRQARAVIEKPVLLANRREYLYRGDFREACDDFLKHVDRRVIEMSSFIEVKVKADFKDGLKPFKSDLIAQLSDFDAAWGEFEKFLLTEKLRVNKLIFADVDRLVSLERQISSVERSLVTCGRLEVNDLSLTKAELEAGFTKTTTKLVNELLIPANIRPESITLAESCLFYGKRIQSSALGDAVVKAYMELRSLLSSGLRLKQDFKTNDEFIRALTNFKVAVENASPALEMAETLPRVAGVKTSGFLTKVNYYESVQA